MSRSVDYLDNAEKVIYFVVDGLETDLDYLDFQLNLKAEIKAKLKSYYNSDKWDNRETEIILQNSYCNIGISEYCGCWSLSVSVRSDYYGNEALAVNHAGLIVKTLEKCLVLSGAKILNKVGTFSNGESVYEYK